MTIFFVVLILFDGWMDGSISSSIENKPVQGTLLCCLVAILILLGQFELSALAGRGGLTIFKIYCAFFSAAIATTWYWPQLFAVTTGKYLSLISALALVGLFLLHYLTFGTKQVLANCGANLLAVFYLGLLALFVVAIRIEIGIAQLFMFIAVVKCADIGAYTAGSLWGKHKFSSKISPKKTWEGMAGAVVLAAVIAVGFAAIFDIMSWQLAIVFAIAFAFIGQFGDLVESLIKRDAEQKDSSASVPGFGGVLDVVDSPLFAAPFAYLFFTITG